jgi:hypothetical protein
MGQNDDMVQNIMYDRVFLLSECSYGLFNAAGLAMRISEFNKGFYCHVLKQNKMKRAKTLTSA